MGDIDVDFFLETLKKLIMSSKLESIIKENHQFESLEEEIKYMRGFLKVTEKKRNKHSGVMNLVRQIRDVVSEAENIIELIVVEAFKAKYQYHLSLDLESVKMEIKTLTAEVKQIYDENICDINGVAGKKLEHSFSKCEAGSSSSSDKKKKKKKKKKDSLGGSNTCKAAEEKVVVGFKEEVETLSGKLHDSGKGGRLEIISMFDRDVGGSRTTVREVYKHPWTSDAFEIRAWENVPYYYAETMKWNWLIRILELASPNKNGDCEKSSEEQLGEDTHKCLKGKKYLLVKDYIWGCEVWGDIQRSLHKECNVSKMLFNSRLVEPNCIQCDPHYLAPLSKSCSLELLQKKVEMGETDVQDTLKQLIMSSKVESIIKEMHQLDSLEEEIMYIRQFVEVTEKKPEHSKVMNLMRQIKHVVFEAENIIELFVVHAFNAYQNQDHLFLDLESVKKEIKTLTAEVKKMHDENMCDINGLAGKKLEHSFFEREGGSSSSRGSNTSKVAEEKVVVGFKEEVKTLLGKLHDNGEGGRLEIISIIGAAGGGKTTLAREVYDHPLMSHTFEIRAWVNVSQDYDTTMKRNLFSPILEIASPKKQGDYEKNSEDKLGEDTHKCLKGKKYLIVMDDIWGTEAWNDIQRSLPKECNGSKVLFTTRQLVEPNSIHCVPHYLAPLLKNCSWELLQKKVFGKKSCPPELVVIGEHIAQKCDGLPLAIVATAGILAMEDKTLYVWEEVSKRLSSIIAKNQDDCMGILELSYNHLPLHLKACFVYIGGFPEDSEILVRELIWLWIAEGFIQPSEGDKSLEDVAKDYLSSLIDRSLVTVARKRSFGGIKACRIHDLLRQLCLNKAKEDNFLEQIYCDGNFSPLGATKHRRLFISNQLFPKFSIGPFAQNLRSFLCLSLQNSTLSCETDLSFFVDNFELFRVLCFISAKCQGKIGRMYHLRYLALHLPKVDTLDFESPISHLFNLETLNLRLAYASWETIPLPQDIFKMVKLRHLYAKRGVFKYHFNCLDPNAAARIGFDSSSKLDCLQTLHPICPCEQCRNFLVRTPNLKKLGFYGELISNDSVLMLPDLELLKCLETLSFSNSRYPAKATSLPPMLKFPPTVTRLTLKKTRIRWEELSSILQTMPSLEVLKLSTLACQGQIWNTTSELEGFSQLKYLRLQDLDIQEWNASEDQFPKLEVLVVKCCAYLKRIPIDFANLNELREIEVWRSRRSAEESAREIQEERRNTRGDDDCINLLTLSNVL